MPYYEEMCVAGKTQEIERYFTYGVHAPGMKRAKKEAMTTEAQKMVNLRMAIKRLRRLMNHNFMDGDFLVRLDFCKEKLPEGSGQMTELVGKFTRKLRTQLRKSGVELKYIYVTEVGPRGGRHVHMMMSRCDTELIRKLWKHGGIHIDPLNTGGQYRKVAEYFIKYSVRTELTEGELVGRRWNPSRNLKQPVVHKRIITAKQFRKTVKPKKGYRLEPDSVQNGISDYTGYGYFRYTLIQDTSHPPEGG